MTEKDLRNGKTDEPNIAASTDSSHKNTKQTAKSTASCNREEKCVSRIWKNKMTQQVYKGKKTAKTQKLRRGLEDAAYLKKVVKKNCIRKIDGRNIRVKTKTDRQNVHNAPHSPMQDQAGDKTMEKRE